MIINEVISIIVTIILAYLLGSIPFAYIFTRLFAGKDIRQLGSGNAGAHNAYREAGMKVAVPVAFFDLSKGTAAVLVAYWLLDVPVREINIYVLLAAIAVIAGHMWSIFLKFRGGNGLSASFGALAVVASWELLIAIGCLLILWAITRNLVLSTNLGLLSVPVSAWFIDKSWLLVGFALIVAGMLVMHFIPAAVTAFVKAGNREKLVDELLRRNHH